MITCKEDLLNTCVPSGNPELLELYVNKAMEFGVSFTSWAGMYNLSPFTFSCVIAGFNIVELTSIDRLAQGFKQLTLSDFELEVKPKTKVEYVKCDFDTTVEYAHLYDHMNAFDCDELKVESLQALVDAIDGNGVYRRVETEITWIDEAEAAFPCASLSQYRNNDNVKMGYWTEAGLIKLAHIIASLTDKPKDLK